MVPGADLIARARVDHVFEATLDWDGGLRRTRAKDGLRRILVGEATPALARSRSLGVPPSFRCALDDQFAMGPPALMDAYASVYAHFADFAHLQPITRNDIAGHGNERILAAHLHYTSTPFDIMAVPAGIMRGHTACGQPLIPLPGERQREKPPPVVAFRGLSRHFM